LTPPPVISKWGEGATPLGKMRWNKILREIRYYMLLIMIFKNFSIIWPSQKSRKNAIFRVFLKKLLVIKLKKKMTF
jgi:hypothetical protein